MVSYVLHMLKLKPMCAYRNNEEWTRKWKKSGNLQKMMVTGWDKGVSECYHLFKTGMLPKLQMFGCMQ